MKSRNRRRLLQAGLGVALIDWRLARAQAPGRTLQVAPRPGAPSGVASSSGGLLVAPRRALVIGNSSYAVGPLKNPANDARAFAEQLAGQGFEVTLGLDLRRAEMLELIGAYGQAVARTKPVALFYFAGHGLQLAWRNYLVPVDAAIKSAADVQAQCIDVNAVIEGIGKAANPMNVIILDACRDDPFGRSQQRGLSQLDAPPGTLLAYATSPGNVASDGEGANGLYTEHLLREIQVPEAKIEDVFKRVRLAVRRGSQGRQIPWESTSLEQDFWFIPPKDLLRQAQEEREERLEREYQAELALWERADGAKETAPLEEYLRRYPSGRFAELAQLQLDRALAQQGENKIEIVSSPDNPYSQGHRMANTHYRAGDSYEYVRLKRDTGERIGKFTQTVTRVSEAEIVFDNGLVLDPLGNIMRQRDGRTFTPRQDEPLDFAVGKRWTTRFSMRNALKGGSALSEFEYRVTRRETVSVPAGTFDCFLIEGNGYSTSQGGFRIHIANKRWVAPERVRRPVASEQFRKVEAHVGRPLRFGKKKGPGEIGEVLNDERLELVGFKQA